MGSGSSIPSRTGRIWTARVSRPCLPPVWSIGVECRGVQRVEGGVRQEDSDATLIMRPTVHLRVTHYALKQHEKHSHQRLTRLRLHLVNLSTDQYSCQFVRCHLCTAVVGKHPSAVFAAVPNRNNIPRCNQVICSSPGGIQGTGSWLR